MRNVSARLVRRMIAPLMRSRRLGLLTERAFWWLWIRTGGWKAGPDALRQRLDPSRQLDAGLAKYLAEVPSEVVRILDVGAGPITGVGYKMPGKTLAITAVDVLADDYDRLLRRRGITPPVRTIYADAERLAERFGRDTFDLVVAQNSLDHTRRPMVAIEQMVQVAKPARTILLAHEIDEGERQNYAGLHQWNLSEQNGRFIIWNRGERVDVTERLSESCEVAARRENGSVVVEIRKHG